MQVPAGFNPSGDRMEPERLSFLGLPRELRDQIYSFALIETTKWERRHRYDCSHCPRTSHELESPLFLVENWPAKPRCCVCRARSSLGLLLVNQQINAEAAPIFWKKNTFCFSSMPGFSRDIGQALRPEFRKMIQNISFIDHEAVRSPLKACEEFWDTLMQCTGLRTLEMHFLSTISRPLHRENCRHFLRMKTELPNLKNVRWAHNGPLVFYSINPSPDPESISGKYMPKWYPDPAWWLTTKAINLATLKNEHDVERSYQKFSQKWVRLVERAMDAHVFAKSPVPVRLIPGKRKLFKCLPDGLNDRHNEEELRLQTGHLATVRFYGLPLSHETVLHNARLRGTAANN